MTPFQRLQQSLPKPVLFALYGALGGLLGALVVGEILWLLLRPPSVRVVTVPPLRLAASPAVTVYQNGRNRFPVRLLRRDYSSAVTIRAAGLPAGVRVEPLTLSGDRLDGEMEIVAAEAPVGASEVTIVAGDDPVAEARLELTVLRLEPPPPALRLAASPAVEVEQESTSPLQVKIARDRFTGAVRLEAIDLPEGVRVAPATLADGSTEGELRVEALAAAAPGKARVTVRGRGVVEGAPGADVVVELRVVRPRRPQVDVVFVLDVTGSMDGEIRGVSEGIVAFARELQERKLDARVGLVAFRDRPNGEESEVLRFEGREPFTRDTRLFAERVRRLEARGGGDGPESVLDALAEASRLPFRPEATRVLLLICDNIPKVPDKEVRSGFACNALLRENRIGQLHLVVRTQSRGRYEAIRADLSGQFFDLDAVSRGRTSLAAALPTVSAAIARLIPPSLPPPGSAAPTPPPASEATDPVPPPPPPVLKGVQSEQAFDADLPTQLRLIAATALWTAAVAAFICLALVTGQQLYLRQSLPAAGEMLRGVVGGLLAGLVGGAFGQYLFQLTAGSVGGEPLFRILGWAMLGGLAGVGLAFFIPNLRPSRGLLGGLLGGVIGAVGFLGAVALLGGSGGDAGARVLGATLLGLAIGLMLAVAERLFRKLWLEVRYSPREQVSVTLGPEPVKVGSDARACTVYARGVAPVALRYWVRDGKVLCEDVAARQTVEIEPDQPRGLANLTLTVRSALVGATPTAQPPAPALPARPAPPPAPASVAAAPPAANSCPECGRPCPGPAGRRYCVRCDRTF